MNISSVLEQARQSEFPFLAELVEETERAVFSAYSANGGGGGRKGALAWFDGVYAERRREGTSVMRVLQVVLNAYLNRASREGRILNSNEEVTMIAFCGAVVMTSE